MLLLILHVFINIIGLIFLMAGSFQILINFGKKQVGNQPEKTNISSNDNKTEKSEEIHGNKNKMIEWGWYLYTFGVILGAFQAKVTLGYYWLWDLKEIFSLLTILGFFTFIVKEMKWNKQTKQILILICLILAISTLLAPTFTYSYHNIFSLFGSN